MDRWPDRWPDAQAPLPALCTSCDGHLSMYQVSFNFLLYFQRYAPDKLFIAKIQKGRNSVNTGDRVMVLAFCNIPFMALYQCIKFLLFYPILLEIRSIQAYCCKN